MRILALSILAFALTSSSFAAEAHPVATYTAAFDDVVVNCVILSDATVQRFTSRDPSVPQVFAVAPKDYAKLDRIITYYGEETSIGPGRFENLSPYTGAELDSAGPLIGVVYRGAVKNELGLVPEKSFIELIQDNAGARQMLKICGLPEE